MENGKNTILAVDDSKTFRIFLEESLMSSGYHVLTANDGAEALGLLKKQYVDMVISDVEMPNMDGMTLCRIVKDKEALKNIYFIMLTGRDDIEDRVQGLNIGADDYIAKSTKQSELIARVNAGMRIRKLEKELLAKNAEIDKRGKILQTALDEISSLMQQVMDNNDLGVRLLNPSLKKCYEVLNCAKTDCPCHGKTGMRCWQLKGTYCGGETQGLFAEKFNNCKECSVFKEATLDPVYMIGECFNNMMYMLEAEHKKLGNAYDDLKLAQTQIFQQEKMASIGQLAAGVAHEINNPMGFIISNLNSLQKYADKILEFSKIQSYAIEDLAAIETASVENTAPVITLLKERRQSLKMDYITEDINNLIRESLDGAERVKRIVQDLKSFSHIDEADCKMSDINAGLDSTINIVWNELKYKATLKKDYGDIPMTKCNPGQLNQVFMNMMINASHAIENQGEIAVRTWSAGGQIYVSISDTGCGVPEEHLNRIFEPFFTTKEVGKGTGLGLCIAYDIVTKHNGKIMVDSKLGHGTTFTISIPVVNEHPDMHK